MRRVDVAICLCLVPMWPTWASSEDNWTRWRGPRMDGIAHDSNPPIEWSETKNVRWKVAVPGHGSSTPIIWGDLLYVLTAIPTDGSTPPPHGTGILMPRKVKAAGADAGRARPRSSRSSSFSP